jgi:hypothetical protein
MRDAVPRMQVRESSVVMAEKERVLKWRLDIQCPPQLGQHRGCGKFGKRLRLQTLALKHRTRDARAIETEIRQCSFDIPGKAGSNTKDHVGILDLEFGRHARQKERRAQSHRCAMFNPLRVFAQTPASKFISVGYVLPRLVSP